jgi:hypothetical protein
MVGMAWAVQPVVEVQYFGNPADSVVGTPARVSPSSVSINLIRRPEPTGVEYISI